MGFFGKGRQAPAAEQGGNGGDAAGDAAHQQIARRPLVEHQRGHDQATQASQDRSGEAGGIEAGANPLVGGELGGKRRVGQVDAGVGGHQQDRHHHVIGGALGDAARGNPPEGRQADAQWHRSPQHPGQARAPAGFGVIAEPADQGVIDGIPNLDHHQQRAGDEGRQPCGAGEKRKQVEAQLGGGQASAGIAKAVANHQAPPGASQGGSRGGHRREPGKSTAIMQNSSAQTPAPSGADTFVLLRA